MTLLDEIGTALARKSVSTGFDYFRGLLARAGDNQELCTEISTLRESFLEMREENTKLRDLLRDAQTELKTRAEVRFEYGAYFKGRGTEGVGGPYCKRCWEVDRNCCTLDQTENLKKEKEWCCPQCHCYYPIPSGYSGVSVRPAIAVGLAGQLENQNE